MNQYVKRFPIENWPHKINLDDYPTICEKLDSMASAQLKPEYCSWLQQQVISRDKKLEWRFNYIHDLGNHIFLEVDTNTIYGWIVFNDDAEIVTFILTHS